jgi:hypothetical protein
VGQSLLERGLRDLGETSETRRFDLQLKLWQAGDFALGRVWPEYQMETNFIGNILNTALELDAKLSSHSIEVDIPDEGKIPQVIFSI